MKVYHLFWFVTFLNIVIGLSGINNESGTVDMPIANMYYVISYFNLSMLIALCYFLTGLGYWIVLRIYKKRLVNPMTFFHTFILIGCFVLYWLVVVYKILFMENVSIYDKYEIFNETFFGLIVLIIVIAQPVFIINLLIGLFSKKLVNEK